MTNSSSSSSSSYTFPSQIGLASLMGAALLTIVSTMLVMYVVLTQIELQTTLSFALSTADNEVELEENAPDATDGHHHQGKSSSESTKKSGSKAEEAVMARHLHLPLYRRLALAAVVSIITFMVYLLLALSSANFVLCWMGMIIVMALLLRQAIFDEVRRDRLDRLAAIVSLVLLLAMAINLAVYANRQHAQGDLYEGKARIVGYDMSNYNQSKDDQMLRTDMEVEWGWSWGCPNLDNDFSCRSFVHGALCEAKEDNSSKALGTASNNDNDSVRRYLQQRSMKKVPYQRRNQVSHKIRQMDEAEKQGNAQNATTNDNQSNNTVVDNKSQSSTQAQGADKNYTALQAENEVLKGENEELKEQNQELQDQLDAYAEYAGQEAEEVDELYSGDYNFEDDEYSEDYWGDTSWGDVWGEYACEDLFSTDMEGVTYNQLLPPGSDGWPFVNIYGNCDSCDAYIVDYYSTEHFQSILGYKRAGLYYGIFSGLAWIITTILMIKQRKRDGSNNMAKDKEIELLPASVAGAFA